MRLLRFIPRCVVVILLVLVGLVLVGTVYPFIGVAGRALLNRTWSRCLMRTCGIRLMVRGTPRLHEAVLLVANHVSWIDIFVINAVRPTAFVAKAEIRRWPVVGWLVAGAGTLFIQRGQRHAVQTVGAAMQRRFARKEAVGLFPEGTTTEGYDLLPFHASLFEPARQANVTIQPLALRFLRNGQRDHFAAFVGEESLVANLWRVLGTRGLAVEVVYLPPLAQENPDGTPVSRLELSRRAREGIRSHLL
ncbi:lysophospholipid acyltransferase family protein [Achromobacter aloeverae]|uniref:1-acyl-sn-glycerol-3-phosphate acyltransferase n=1 Tax=Achromobacter aloeverae TaxID=1750518 RepID=A0A4Q1HFT8_9BURK|nr:lysophospholipid acyltransferase family protein [Achromobacter aloeverae]RXN84729.1 1-acyl-sn-glycerol-3-phosphate acyltransferase [Achromobacter aloeverae]